MRALPPYQLWQCISSTCGYETMAGRKPTGPCPRCQAADNHGNGLALAPPPAAPSAPPPPPPGEGVAQE